MKALQWAEAGLVCPTGIIFFSFTFVLQACSCCRNNPVVIHNYRDKERGMEGIVAEAAVVDKEAEGDSEA